MVEFKRTSFKQIKAFRACSIIGAILLLCFLIYTFLHAPVAAAETVALKPYSVEVERDVPMRKQTPILLVHHIGEVSIQGWVQDRIRVKLKKRVIAENQEQADQLFKQVDLMTLETPKTFEMRMGIARGTDLVTKLRAQKQNSVEVDIEIKAPYQLDLSLILGKNQGFSVQQWKGSLTVNAQESSGRFSKLQLKGPLQISCMGCELELSDSKVDGRLLGSNKPIVVRNVETTGLMIDTTSGEVKLENTKGKIMAHTESGKLNSQDHTGELSFETDSGGFFLTGFKGKAEAQTTSGQMIVEADLVDRLLNLESQKGDIQVSLLHSFEGKLDLSSLKGEVVVQFPVEAIRDRAETNYGPLLPGRVNALVGSRAGTVIHAETKQGGIRVLRRLK